MKLVIKCAPLIAIMILFVPAAHASVWTEVLEAFAKSGPRSARAAEKFGAETAVREHPHSVGEHLLTESIKEVVKGAADGNHGNDDDKDKRR